MVFVFTIYKALFGDRLYIIPSFTHTSISEDILLYTYIYTIDIAENYS